MTSPLPLFLLGILLHSTFAADWSYYGSHGPQFWGKTYPVCNDNSQSPINIYEGDVLADSVSEPFTFTNYDVSRGLTMSLSNNGHTAVVALSGSSIPEISGGGLGGAFKAAQFHFHWNVKANEGSEHKISSHGYPSELHIVHYRKTYASINDAIDKSDGLAVLGFMLDVSKADNSNYADLVSSLEKVQLKDSSAVTLKEATLKSLLPSTLDRFYRYSGSLTTPGCFESVTWTVFKDKIYISQDQLDALLELRGADNKPIGDNVRPVQPINGRSVQASFNPDIHWSHNHGKYDVKHWADYYESCGKDSQSPVNIPYSASTKEALGTLIFKDFDVTEGITMSLTNNGHAAQVNMAGAVPTMTGGGLPEVYKVAQFHFHWGSSSIKGSEHTVDGKQYPLEVHIVTYKSSLGNLGNAAKKPEGLAVLGFFFEIAEQDNPALDSFISKFNMITSPKSQVPISTMSLDSFLPADRTKFYRYPGSLTTPGCFESVIWTVFDSKIAISESQMSKFRALKSSDKDEDKVYFALVNNYRPVQNLNSRVVKRNFDPTPLANQPWGYFGAVDAANWYKNYPVCASTLRQSPIDISNEDVLYRKIPAFTFNGFGTTDGLSLELNNNGHSAVVVYKAGDLTVSNGGLPGTFKVAQFHFHWGSTDTKGSEHTIDGNAYPLELHIVTYNTIYSDIGVAMTQGNGLAVLGIMFKVSDTDNPALYSVLASLPDIKKPKTSKMLAAFSLNDLMPTNRFSFYRYDGSLTTPNCAESVTWTVFEEPLTISRRQLELFRALESSEKDAQNNYMPMVDNFRPVQDIGEREVYANFFINAAPSPKVALSPIIACIFYTVCNINIW